MLWAPRVTAKGLFCSWCSLGPMDSTEVEKPLSVPLQSLLLSQHFHSKARDQVASLLWWVPGYLLSPLRASAQHFLVKVLSLLSLNGTHTHTHSH